MNNFFHVVCGLSVWLALGSVACGEQLTPTSLDPKLAESREKAFTSWGDKEQTGATWRQLSSTHIPVYGEYRADGWQRAIYIPNPGAGYWALDGLTEDSLWQTEREKLKIGDELISAGSHEGEDGTTKYWALWAPRTKAYLIKEKMRELGIKPARVDIDPLAQNEDDRGKLLDAATLYTFSGEMAFHDAEGNVRYDLTITNGQVSGWQHWRDDEKPVGQIVGGWFDFDRRRLSVLIQGADHVEAQWRSQLKQFHIDLSKRQVVCDYELYDYGRRNEGSPVGAPNVLDKLDRIEHLVKPDHAQ